MELKEDFESLAKDVQEYLKRSLDNTKLTLVEELSLMIGNALATMIVTMMLFVALLFILAAMVALLSEVVGFVLAMLIAGAVVVILAAVAGGFIYLKGRSVPEESPKMPPKAFRK